MTKQLFDMQDRLAASMKKELSAVDYNGFTADFWTSAANESYLGVTCHFITNTWELKSYVLQTRSVPECHTAVNIASRLQETLEEWEIAGTLQGITTDNGRNIVNAVTDHLHWKHFPCFGHTLQLVVPEVSTITASRTLST